MAKKQKKKHEEPAVEDTDNNPPESHHGKNIHSVATPSSIIEHHTDQVKTPKRKRLFARWLVAILLLLTVVTCTILFLANQKQTPSTVQNTDSNASKTEEEQVEATWVEYRNDDARFTFQHPKNWIPTTDDAEFRDGELAVVSGKLVSPSGKPLEWIYEVWGGKGGDCEPLKDDVPFAEGNECNSKTVYSAEILPLPVAPQSKLLDGKYKQLILTKTKYLAGGYEKPTTYQICLDDYYADDGPYHGTVGTRMGLLLPCKYWGTGFNARFDVENEQAFRSEETKTAEQIMRTFNSF